MGIGQGENSYSKFTSVYPESKPIGAPKFTPDDVASDYCEAVSSLKAGNIKAACMMARSAIETAVVGKGETKGGLQDKIESLAKKHVITQALADWAAEVKDIGNDAAHAAERKAVLTVEDAQDAISYAEMLFTYLYTLPGMIKERRKKEPSE